MDKYPVYLDTCPTYDVDRIVSIIEQALENIPLTKPISGRVVIKPNLVMAHPKIATEGFTRKEVIEGILRTIQTKGENVRKIDIVEKSGLGVTTASMFRWAGYKKLTRKYPVKLRAMEERPICKVVLQNGCLHPYISIAREMAERDFLIFVPKLKTNVLSHGYTGTLKLNVGTVDGKERIFHHNRNLSVKIVDILEAANPDLIITDGVRLCFGGNQMTQHGTDFGVIAVSANAVAHDMVCARLLSLDPFKIEHIKEAIDRGYGPASFNEIEIVGDFPVKKGQTIVNGLDFGFYPVDRFPSNFRIHTGTPYCTGGCQGIFLDWLHMIKDRKPKLLKHFPKISVLIGKVEKAIEDRTILLVGNCAQASHSIEAKRIVRIKGCPPTHKRIVWDMMVKFLLIAPLVRPSLIIDGFILYPLKKFKGWIMNIRFIPSQNT
jgi:uncharacterized protein (DUF362 family)